MPDADLTEVKSGVARIFKANAQTLEQLFSGRSIKIKKSVDMDTAIKYRLKFRETGAVVDIRPAGTAAVPGSAPQNPPATDTETLPAATQVQPQQADNSLPDSGLAPVGSRIDETPEPPPANIDTSGLSAGEANTGSLEGFAEITASVPLPDISNLTFGPEDENLDSSVPPPPLEIDISELMIDQFSNQLDDSMPVAPADIDTSNLSVADANTGSLEEFNSRPAPVPLPDISKLEIED